MVSFWPYFATASDDQWFSHVFPKPVAPDGLLWRQQPCVEVSLGAVTKVLVYSCIFDPSWIFLRGIPGKIIETTWNHWIAGWNVTCQAFNDMFLPFFRWSFSSFFHNFSCCTYCARNAMFPGVRSCPSNTEVMPGVLGRPTHLMLSDDWNVLERKCLGIFWVQRVFMCFDDLFLGMDFFNFEGCYDVLWSTQCYMVI